MHFSKPFPVDYITEDAEVILENQLELVFSLLKEKGLKEEEIAISLMRQDHRILLMKSLEFWKSEKYKKYNQVQNKHQFYAIRGESVKEFLENSKKYS